MAGSLFLPAAMFRPYTGGVTLPSYGDVGSTNFRGSVLVFADTAIREISYCNAFDIPSDFPAAPASVTATVVWTSAVTSGNFQVDLDYLLVDGNDTASMNQAAVQAVTAADAAPSVAHRRLFIDLIPTASNWNNAANKTIQILLARDGATEASGIAGNVIVFGVRISWT